MEFLTSHFDSPIFLLLLPLLWGVAIWLLAPRRRTRRTSAMVLPGASQLPHHSRGWRVRLVPHLQWLRLVALTAGIIALARPVTVSPEEQNVEGIDLVVALDMSGSMSVVDVTTAQLAMLQAAGREPDNRLRVAINVLNKFIRSRHNDRIGLVIFGRDAYTLFPLTLDYQTTLGMVDGLKLGDIDPSGTAIGNAIGRSVALLRHSDAVTKTIVLITDGDNQGGNIAPREGARLAKEKEISIFPILVGSEELAMEPVGSDFFNSRMVYRKANSPANPELLKEIAAMTGGQYFNSVNRSELERDLQVILDSLEKTKIEDLPAATRTAHFAIFLYLAMALIALEFTLRVFIVRKFP